ncbi:MAG: type II toxin-antitoxin system VapC family toxin [Vicinamibacterales bacterium]
MSLLLDTGVLYAMADADDSWHRRVVRYLAKTSDVLITPVSVVPEAAYLLRARLGPGVEQQFIASLAAGEIAVEMLTVADIVRTAALMNDRPDLGFVDSSVVVVAERLRLTRIATTDRRHFSSIVPKHRTSFDLVP